MKKILLLIYLLMYFAPTFAQYPSPLPSSGQISIQQIYNWMNAAGEMPYSTSYSINTLNSASHLTDKTAPYSLSDWYGYYLLLTASISGGGPSPICYNTAPGTFTATGGGGIGTYTYLWYKDGVSTGTTTQTYAPGNLIATTTFYCAITSGTIGTVNTGTTSIMVYGDIIPGTISGTPTSICNGSNVNYTLGGFNNGIFSRFQYQWGGTGGAWTDLSNVNPYVWPSSNPGGTLYVRGVVTNGLCSAYSPAVNTVIDAAPTMGTLCNTGPIDFCSAGGDWSSVPISVSGATGTIMWQWGESNGTWNDWVSGTSPAYVMFPKKVATSDGNADRVRYRVTNGLCAATGYSAPILLQNRYNETPLSLTSSKANILSGATVTLTATFPPTNINILGAVEFFSGSCGGTPIATLIAGNNVNSVSYIVTPPVGATTYFARYNPGAGFAATACVSTTVTAVVVKVGDYYLGGRIFYILQPGDPGYIAGEIHGLIVSLPVLSTAIWWGSPVTTGATGTAIGTGKANTDAIIASQGAGSYAASLCRTLGPEWFLPSKDELTKLYLNRYAVGAVSNATFWCSSELAPNMVWVVTFKTGWTGGTGKDWTDSLFAVQAF